MPAKTNCVTDYITLEGKRIPRELRNGEWTFTTVDQLIMATRDMAERLKGVAASTELNPIAKRQHNDRS